MYGDPTARVLLQAELRPFRKSVEAVIRANAAHDAIVQVQQDIADLLERSVEAASYVKTKPRMGDVASRVALELARLHDVGTTPFEILATTTAVLLVDSLRPMKPAILFCAIARQVTLLHKIGAKFKSDPRYGTRPERISLPARIDIGRRFAELCAATFAAVQATVEEADQAKAIRWRKIQQALADKPLTVPGRTKFATAGGTVVTTFSDPPTTPLSSSLQLHRRTTQNEQPTLHHWHLAGRSDFRHRWTRGRHPAEQRRPACPARRPCWPDRLGHDQRR
jgi:hypothetical protein